MRSSTKSESNCNNNSDNMNNNLDESDKRSADDVIDIADDTECSSKLLNQTGNGESELTQRIEIADSDKSAKVNVYEQVRRKKIIFIMTTVKFATSAVTTTEGSHR
jgi:hypothetical protein